VIGSGGAGLFAVLKAAEFRADLDITLISKGAIGRSGCTRMVQGGFNAVLNDGDSVEKHFLDTLNGGKFLNDQELAWTLVNDAPKVIHDLEVKYGCFFDRDESGRIKQKAFAGQSFDRTVHKGDLTGIEIMSRLREQLFRVRPRELEDVRALDLIMSKEGSISGVSCLDVRTGKFIFVNAKCVIVTTGGAATMYKIAAPAREKTGDGVAMCLRAGLKVRDMEMLQFHPTGLLAGESRMTGAVLEEGLRGAGAYLKNASGERFMSRYDSERMERSTRDVVARASYTEIMSGRGTKGGGVFIDISHLGKDEVQRRFPGMVERTRLIGSDLATGPVEVSPTSHFAMGGVEIGIDCETAIPGLFVAGEDSGGTHGANRLGGNGVAESTVFGSRAGVACAKSVDQFKLNKPDEYSLQNSFARAVRIIQSEGAESPFDLTNTLKETMWENFGVVRSESKIATAESDLLNLRLRLNHINVPKNKVFNVALNEALDLENQIEVALSMVRSGALRKETRGSHARYDYVDSDDDNWLKFISYQLGDGDNYSLETVPVVFSRVTPK
jgi:succinate dehydrogenase / fumarate reductase flavoprotein subunit/fumarate reductase flavoprotein subunit